MEEYKGNAKTNPKKSPTNLKTDSNQAKYDLEGNFKKIYKQKPRERCEL